MRGERERGSEIEESERTEGSGGTQVARGIRCCQAPEALIHASRGPATCLATSSSSMGAEHRGEAWRETDRQTDRQREGERAREEGCSEQARPVGGSSRRRGSTERIHCRDFVAPLSSNST